MRWFTRTAGTGSLPSRNQRYAVWGWIPCRWAHSVRFTLQSHHGNVCTISINHYTASSRQPQGHRADLNRDTLWPVLGGYGMRPVSQEAVDEVWSALRFRLLKPGEPPFTGGRG